MERLKTIDYVSGLTHKDVREAINANSDVANGNFDELAAGMQEATGGASDAAEAAAAAQTAADAAAKAAQGATETAQAANAAAGEAKQTAEAAKSTAEGAAEAAAEAQRVASAAEEVADGAAATAEAAQEAATGAQGTAETAARDAAQAKQDAATAKSDAADAKSTAEGAQSSAETAGRNAAQAVETAGAAQTAAEGAQRTAETANATAGAAKTAADGAVKDAATAKSDAATAKSTAETASQTASTAKSTADTAKQTADTAKQTAEGAKASADDVTGDVTAMGLSQSFLADYAGSGEPVAAGASAVSVLTSTLKSGELVPWHGWFTLVACYTTEDARAQLGAVGTHEGSAEQVIVPMTRVSAGERAVARLTADPGTRTVTLEGGDAVEVRKLTTSGALTLHWAVLYESDEYGNPRRRGGSLREQLCSYYQLRIDGGFAPDTHVRIPVVYNERTGWFECNGLTDLTWGDMLAVAKTDVQTPSRDFGVTLSGAKLYCRTNTFMHSGSSQTTYNNFQLIGTEVLHVNNVLGCPGLGWLSNNCAQLLAILGRFNLHYYTSFNPGNAFGQQSTLETLKIYNIKFNLKAPHKMLSWDSFKYLIDNADEGIDERGITVTVHADVYAKMTGGTVDDWGSLGTLAEEKGVELVAYGESGYPFLTRVLWHGYKRLENKINAAKSGDVIYIHPEDRQKIMSAQKDDWAALVTAGVEKRITFALPAES